MRLKERTGKKRSGFPVWVVALLILVAASIAYLAVNEPKPPVREKKVEPAAATKPEPPLRVELAPKADEKPPSAAPPAPEPAMQPQVRDLNCGGAACRACTAQARSPRTRA